MCWSKQYGCDLVRHSQKGGGENVLPNPHSRGMKTLLPRSRGRTRFQALANGAMLLKPNLAGANLQSPGTRIKTSFQSKPKVGVDKLATSRMVNLKK